VRRGAHFTESQSRRHQSPAMVCTS
jgi:hypothetical protein